jgi:hypothetical protein
VKEALQIDGVRVLAARDDVLAMKIGGQKAIKEGKELALTLEEPAHLGLGLARERAHDGAVPVVATIHHRDDGEPGRRAALVEPLDQGLKMRVRRERLGLVDELRAGLPQQHRDGAAAFVAIAGHLRADEIAGVLWQAQRADERGEVAREALQHLHPGGDRLLDEDAEDPGQHRVFLEEAHHPARLREPREEAREPLFARVAGQALFEARHVHFEHERALEHAAELSLEAGHERGSDGVRGERRSPERGHDAGRLLAERALGVAHEGGGHLCQGLSLEHERRLPAIDLLDEVHPRRQSGRRREGALAAIQCAKKARRRGDGGRSHGSLARKKRPHPTSECGHRMPGISTRTSSTSPGSWDKPSCSCSSCHRRRRSARRR